ncbi:MarR family transcriptional regulator [Veronia nyctiphanis]|uniref:MarR family transcriptional regulator n=1 Tax=Veronia nyctiphanis TaxID=1278244 RepID=A0A4Q0YTY2_9GAMM|nr:MarR family transcriptional regulator [Veronia nyctiphanis]RXJ74215.1 MarR family transcriptional regulator [Veronia nyctiphanis]
MKISHKRKVQLKLKKRILTTTSVTAAPKVKTVKAAPVAEKKAVSDTTVVKKVVADLALTPKQQQVLDIVRGSPEGINPKGIGLEAGQEDGKAASWATGALKKLAEGGMVERVQLAGNKVIYKAL